MPALRGVPGRCRGTGITVRRRNRHRGSTGAHPRQQLHVPPHPHGSTTTAEGARKCTLDRRYLCIKPLNGAQPLPRVHRNAPSTGFAPLRSPLHHPTTAEGAALCTLDSNYTSQPACTATQPSSREHLTAHSTADGPAPGHPAGSNRHRRCTGMHPRPDSPPLRPPFHHPTATEGAALRTLDSR